MREDISNAFVRLLDATERECLVLRYGLHDGVTNSIEETAEIMDFCDPDDVSLVLSSCAFRLLLLLLLFEVVRMFYPRAERKLA